MTHDLNDTLVFVKVVESGSFIAAANALRLPKTTVSRKVQELETRLGAQLLHRTTRRIGLTEAGHLYFEHCRRIVRDLDEAQSAVGQLQGGPRGWLRISVPYSVGVTWISPLLGEFQARYPEVRVEMNFSNDPREPIGEDVDVALRGGATPDANLDARRLAVFRTRVYASPVYLERYGEPMHPDELRHHRTLAISPCRRNNGYFWTLSNEAGSADYPIHPVMAADDSGPLRGALLGGDAIMLEAEVAVRAFAELGFIRPVLTDWRGPECELKALFQRGRAQSPKVRAFVDFLSECLDPESSYKQVLCPEIRYCRDSECDLDEGAVWYGMAVADAVRDTALRGAQLQSGTNVPAVLPPARDAVNGASPRRETYAATP